MQKKKEARKVKILAKNFFLPIFAFSLTRGGK
jgi:hypothetical protein